MNSKSLVLYFLIIQLLSFSCQQAEPKEAYIQEIPLAGNVYQTKGSSDEKIGEKGIESWTNSDSEFAVFVNAAQEQPVELYFNLSSPAQAHSKVKILLKGTEAVLNINPSDAEVAISHLFTLKPGYNDIRFQALEKDGAHYALVEKLSIHSEVDLPLTYVKDNTDNRFYWGRRGPSVHLSYTYPENESFKWFYNEVTVPVGSDPIGSYFMANGFAEGYFGIQVNSETERRILFSVWSPFVTDNPTEIPNDEKIILLNKGEGVYTGEFGNEGSGGQSYLVYNWKAGKTYRFLNSIEPDGKGNTKYTAYFMDPAQGEWKLIASFLRPKTDTWYQRPHSFLENFVPEKGHLTRMAYYNNQWLVDSKGNWVELDEAKFTGDDIARRSYRLDYEGGESNGSFYLKNGGFFTKKYELNSMHERAAKNQQPQVNLNSLP